MVGDAGLNMHTLIQTWSSGTEIFDAAALGRDLE
jgi:hypothetical protein